MAGVRIRHATERTCTYVLVDASRPYKEPFACRVCGVIHTFKTYHIALDINGACIVSPEVAERIGRLGPQTGFTIMNEVKKPPPLYIGLNGSKHPDVPSIVINKKLKEPGRG